MNDQNEETPGLNVEALFILGEDRVSRGLERLRLARGARLRTGRMALLLTIVAWVPLLVLAIIEGVAWGVGVEVPFVRDFLPYGQFLLAIPVLVLGEVAVARHLGLAVSELRRSDVLAPTATPELERLLAILVERWRGPLVNAVFFILTCAITGVSLWGARVWLTGGWQVAGEGMTLAGWWYLLVSLPVIRFLALRWLWRLSLWVWLLWRVARLELQPRPTHPDRAGGLAFLGGTQAAFGVLVFAFGVQLSCLIADAVHFRGADLMAYRGQVVMFVVLAVITLMMPLLIFAPKLTRAREEGLLHLSGAGHRGADSLERELLASKGAALPSEEISGLSDFGALYENARLMRPVPMEWRHILAVILAAAMPFAPLIFLVMSAQKVFQTLVKLII